MKIELVSLYNCYFAGFVFQQETEAQAFSVQLADYLGMDLAKTNDDSPCHVFVYETEITAFSRVCDFLNGIPKAKRCFTLTGAGLVTMMHLETPSARISSLLVNRFIEEFGSDTWVEAENTKDQKAVYTVRLRVGIEQSDALLHFFFDFVSRKSLELALPAALYLRVMRESQEDFDLYSLGGLTPN